MLALAGDENYMPGLLISMASALTHVPVSLEVEVVIFDEGISEASASTLAQVVANIRPSTRLRIVSGMKDAAIDVPVSGHLTQAAYARLLVPEVCPDAELALYLDSDTLTQSSIAELLAASLGEAPLAAAVDAGAPTQAARNAYGELAGGRRQDAVYVNSGVLLMNLPAWRRRQLGPALLRYIERNREHLRFHDQDAINVVLADEAAILDGRWNYQLRVERQRGGRAALDRAAVIHYNDPAKPWTTVSWLRQEAVARAAGIRWWRFALSASCLPPRTRVRMAKLLIAAVTRAARSTVGRIVRRFWSPPRSTLMSRRRMTAPRT